MHFTLGLVLAPLLAWPVLGDSSVYYCSSVNTGSSNPGNSSIYQSQGSCEQLCNDDYAFGILQDKMCWCSNIAPNKATNVDNDECSDKCPGYPQDKCGNQSKGYFAYYEMSMHMPSGTATVSSTASATGTSTGSSDNSDSSTTGSSTVAVQTVSGVVHTVTVPGSQSTGGSDASDSKKDSSSGLSSGAVAGVAVGAVAGAGALILGIVMCVLAKRRARQNSPDGSVSNILLDGRQSKGSQMSFMKGVFSDGHSHTLSAGSSINPNRHPTFTDNRMKTDATLYPNGHRDSSVSLQDNEDYSRPVLRLTNPD